MLDSSRSGWEYENEAAQFPLDPDEEDAAAGSEEPGAPREERRAASRADCTAGNNMATSMPIIAITTSSSTSVNPKCRRATWVEWS